MLRVKFPELTPLGYNLDFGDNCESYGRIGLLPILLLPTSILLLFFVIRDPFSSSLFIGTFCSFINESTDFDGATLFPSKILLFLILLSFDLLLYYIISLFLLLWLISRFSVSLSLSLYLSFYLGG